jgi:hypothetical protein
MDEQRAASAWFVGTVAALGILVLVLLSGYHAA